MQNHDLASRHHPEHWHRPPQPDGPTSTRPAVLAAVVLIASVIGVVGAVVDSERPGYWFFVVVSILAVVSAAIFLVFAVVRKPPIVPVGGDADRR